MARKGALLVSIGLITYLTTIMAKAQSGDASSFANSAFATNLYNVLKKESGNVFFSPYSLQVALAMVYTGATGNTATELRRSLNFAEDKTALSKAVQSSAASLTSSSDVTLNIANGVFLQKDYPLKEGFTKTMQDVFEAKARSVNFGENVEAAKEINTFVNEKTNGKISQLFTPDSFNELTRLVLVNAIYFKGFWTKKFNPTDSFEGDFHLNNKEKVKVEFMSQTSEFNINECDDLKATVVELPYRGDLSMILIVPREIEGIKYVESKMKDLDLKALVQNTSSTNIKLIMPKFKLEQKIDLNEPLKELGMKEMFDPGRADFGGITDRKDLYVSQAVQKAFIEVNEEGSEAAASTAIRFVMRKMPLPPVEVNVNGPFLFFVREAQGAILFAGRVAKL